MELVLSPHHADIGDQTQVSDLASVLLPGRAISLTLTHIYFRQSHTAQADLLILQPPPLQGWDYSCALCLVCPKSLLKLL